jgi:hypothetical protein
LPPEPGRGLLTAETFEVTKDERQAEPIREQIEFLVEDGNGLTPGQIRTDVRGLRGRSDHGLSSRLPLPRADHADGDPVGDGEQPRPKTTVPPHAVTLLNEDEKRRLKRILDIDPGTEDLPTGGQDGAFVPTHEFRERGLVRTKLIAVEQLAVADSSDAGIRK